ncbi:MAG: hypothetical protein AAFY88_12690 [Acidobacteriota bacterium]
MPDSVRTFYRSFDGQRRLADLFSHDEATWRRQVELLELQIGKGAILLLPSPLAELRAEAEARGGGEEIFVARSPVA